MTTPSLKDELLPCPFCGGGARMLKREIGLRGRNNWDWWHAIQCASCNAAVGYDDNRYRDKDDAIKAWNTRPSLANAALDLLAACEKAEELLSPFEESGFLGELALVNVRAAIKKASADRLRNPGSEG